MNDEQKTTAEALVTVYINSNVSMYDPAWNTSLNAAGQQVIAAMQAGQSLHDIESTDNAQVVEIVGYLREKMFPQGEVITKPTETKPAPADDKLSAVSALRLAIGLPLAILHGVVELGLFAGLLEAGKLESMIARRRAKQADKSGASHEN